MKKYCFLLAVCLLFFQISVSADIISQLTEAESYLGIDNSDLPVIERISAIEDEIGISHTNDTIPGRVEAIFKEIGISDSVTNDIVSETSEEVLNEPDDTYEEPEEESLVIAEEEESDDTADVQTVAPIPYDLTFASSDVSEYPNVRLYFGLEDDNGQPITLTSFDGTVTETIAGGAEIERKVRQVQRLEGNQGLSIDIVADKSGSMEYDLSTMQSIMSDFVRSLDYAVGDQVEILSFDSYVMYMCTYTQDVSLLLNGISNMTAYGDTALYDALVNGIQNAGSRAGARCVIGFTDGADNVSVYTPDEVIRLSQEREVPVYLIGTGGADRGVLKYIADSTGGYYWDVYSISDISDILNLIYRDQKDMYCVEYESDPGADPYARRTVSCSITDGTNIGRTDDLVFQATPVIQTAPHTSRYELIKADVSWQQANDECIAKGGHLVTITSQPEMDQMVQMCEQAGIKYCWIGGYTSVRNKAAFGHWITGEPFAYTAWYPGEPSRNDLDGTPEFYLMLWKVETAWSWNDQRNDVVADYDYFKGVIGYICEYED